MKKIFFIFWVLCISVTNVYSWSSMDFTGFFATHQFLNKTAYQEIRKHPAYYRSGFPSLYDIQRHGSVSILKTGLGPDVDGNSKFSEHWYNPANGQGQAPATIKKLHAELIEALILAPKNNSDKQARENKAHLAAYSAHYIQDMTCPMHVSGMEGSKVSRNKVGFRDDISPYEKNPYTINEWEKFVDRYNDIKNKYNDFFDPLYFNGNMIFSTMGGTHVLYEAHVETLYHQQPAAEKTKRWKILKDEEGFIPDFYGSVNKDMALLAIEAAKETYKQIGTRYAPKRLWIDNTNETTILASIQVPYDEWWRAIQLTYALWRSSFCALHIEKDDIKFVKVPNAPNKYKLSVSVTNFEPEALARNIKIRYKIEGDIRTDGKVSFSDSIPPNDTSGWYLAKKPFNIDDLKGLSGKITLEIEGEYDEQIPDSGFKRVKYDLTDIRIDAVRMPYVLNEFKDRAILVLKNNPFYFNVKTESAGVPDKILKANMVKSQFPEPGVWIAIGDTVVLKVLDEFKENSPDLNSDITAGENGVTGVPGHNNEYSTETNETDDQIIVPDVEKKSVKDAIQTLTMAGLGYSPVGGDPAPSRALFAHIQKQKPEKGKLLSPNNPVELTIYSDVQIPDVGGLTAEKAKDKLNKAGFAMTPAGGDPAPKEELSFCVQSQQPAPESSGKNINAVTVTFYTEFKQLTVPSIKNLSQAQAQGVLADLGLNLDSAFGWGEHAATKDQVGTIHSQKPEEGEAIEPGGQVKAWFYFTVVPNVIGKPFKQAVSDMGAAWFTSHWEWGDIVENKHKWNTIQSQSLEAEEKKKEVGIQVKLTVYKKPDQKKNSYQALLGHWEGYNTKEKSKIKALIHLEILSVDPNGILQGSLITPKQVIQLHNPGKTTMSISRKEMPVQGIVKGNKITLSYKISSGKGKSKGIWNTQNMTINGTNSISSKYAQGGKWHTNGVIFYLKKK